MTIETKYNIGDEVSYIPLYSALFSAVTSTITSTIIRAYINIADDDDIAVNYRMSNGDTVGESRILQK